MSTFCLPSLMTPTANAIDVSNTRPCGTMPTVPATALRIASFSASCTWSWLQTSRITVGTSSQPTRPRIQSTPARSSDGRG